jgi:hypothetical protein
MQRLQQQRMQQMQAQRQRLLDRQAQQQGQAQHRQQDQLRRKQQQDDTKRTKNAASKGTDLAVLTATVVPARLQGRLTSLSERLPNLKTDAQHRKHLQRAGKLGTAAPGSGGGGNNSGGSGGTPPEKRLKDEFGKHAGKNGGDSARPTIRLNASTRIAIARFAVTAEKGASTNFRSASLLKDHFKKHGAEFDARTPAHYRRLADKFLTGSIGPDTVEKKRSSDGDTVRYNSKTNEFGVVSQDGIIRTYFKLDKTKHKHNTNMDYFNAQ